MNSVINEIKKYVDGNGIKELSAEEQLVLLKKFRENNDVDARTSLMESMYLMLIKIVNERSFKYDLNADDFFMRACEYCLKGFEIYNEEKNMTVSTYIYNYVNMRLLEKVKLGIKDDSGVDLNYSTCFKDKMKKIIDFIVKFKNENGKDVEPSYKDIAVGVKMKIKEVEKFMNEDNYSMVNNTIMNEDGEVSIFDYVSDDKINIENEVIDNIFFENIEDFLGEREIEILKSIKYNIDTKGKFNKSDIGREVGLSSERINSIIKNIKSKIVENLSLESKKEMKKMLENLNSVERLIVKEREEGKRTNGIAKRLKMDVKEVKSILDNFDEKVKKIESNENVVNDVLRMVG
ncbi:hypothetical protein [Virgibacillus sp. DJP39]|uniref:hypothetical protein n=1 Tax=Virgibacillus sp. DJP39 TaxID=3409790 RepID=UPI003BB4BCC2